MDDQLPGSAHPVLLLPTDAARPDAPATEPLMQVALTKQPARRRGVVYCPVIAARVLPLRIALSEPLVWRLRTMQEQLAAGLAAPGGMSTVQGRPQAASAEIPLQVRESIRKSPGVWCLLVLM